MTTTDLEFHPISSIFPLMDGADFSALRDDIATNGQHEPIWVHDGKVIDGRNRLRACREIGIEPAIREWNGQGDLTAFVVSLNLHRRHLDESQRAMVAAKIKPLFEAEARENQGKRTDLSANLRKSPPIHAGEKAADLVNVSPRSVDSASKVLKDGTPELAEAVERGDAKVSAAAEIALLPKADQAAVVAGGPEAIKSKAAEIRTERTLNRLVETEADVQTVDVAPPERGTESAPEQALLIPETSSAPTQADKFHRLITELNYLVGSIQSPKNPGIRGWGGIEGIVESMTPDQRNYSRRMLRHHIDVFKGWIDRMDQFGRKSKCRTP